MTDEGDTILKIFNVSEPEHYYRANENKLKRWVLQNNLHNLDSHEFDFFKDISTSVGHLMQRKVRLFFVSYEGFKKWVFMIVFFIPFGQIFVKSLICSDFSVFWKTKDILEFSLVGFMA